MNSVRKNGVCLSAQKLEERLVGFRDRYDPNTMGREKRSRRARRDSWMLPKYYSPYLSQRPDFKKIALKAVRRTLEEDPPTENQNVP